MIALLLVLLLDGMIREPSAACEAEYVQKCLQESDDPDCTVPCAEEWHAAGEPWRKAETVVEEEHAEEYEPEVPGVCHLRAGVVKVLLTKPLAVVYVEYLDERCGEDNPLFESDTVSITYVEEVDKNPATIGCKGEDVDRCPVRIFLADVEGPIGIHKIRVYAGDEGQAEITVKLRGFTERSKLAEKEKEN